MLVMDFVRPANSTGIPIIGIAEHFKALVNKNIMYHKIGDSIGQYAEAQRPTIPERSGAAQSATYQAWAPQDWSQRDGHDY